MVDGQWEFAEHGHVMEISSIADMICVLCRSLVIEPSFSEGQDADGLVWSLPAFVPLLNIKEGGHLTLTNFTIVAKTDECRGVTPKREWFFQGEHLSMPVFGGLIPRTFMMTPGNGTDGMDGNPASVNLQSMRFKFER